MATLAIRHRRPLRDSRADASHSRAGEAGQQLANIGWLMHRTLCGMLAGAPRFSPAACSGKHVHQRHLIRFRARQKARAASMIVTPEKAAESAKALALPEEDGLPYANTRRVLIIAITVMRVAPMIVVVAVVAVTVIAAVVSIVVIAAVVTVIVMGSVVIISSAPIMSAVDASNAPRR